MECNYVTTCLADVSILLPITTMFDNCVPWRQLGSCSVTRTFLSLQRVWLARLGIHSFFGAERCYVTLWQEPALAQEIRLGLADCLSLWEGGVWGRDYDKINIYS